MKRIYDVVAAVGKYKTRSGDEKTRWQKVGYIIETEKGLRLALERTFNPAGVPVRDQGASSVVYLSLFKVEDEQDAQQRQDSGDIASMPNDLPF